MKKEDIEFLKELKEKIKTGNRCDEAEPAFWMIKDRECYFNSDSDGADEAILINPNECGHTYQEDEIEEVKEALAKTAEDNYFDEELAECKTIKDVINLMEENCITENNDNSAKIVYVHYYWKIRDDTGAFLTYEDAEEHLNKNYYHYSGKAYPYAMTALRNPTFERLWKIITETDWDKEIEDNGRKRI